MKIGNLKHNAHCDEGIHELKCCSIALTKHVSRCEKAEVHRNIQLSRHLVPVQFSANPGICTIARLGVLHKHYWHFLHHSHHTFSVPLNVPHSAILLWLREYLPSLSINISRLHMRLPFRLQYPISWLLNRKVFATYAHSIIDKNTSFSSWPDASSSRHHLHDRLLFVLGGWWPDTSHPDRRSEISRMVSVDHLSAWLCWSFQDCDTSSSATR